MFAFIFKSLIFIADFGKLANLSTVWDLNEIFWGEHKINGVIFFFSVEMETFAKYPFTFYIIALILQDFICDFL